MDPVVPPLVIRAVEFQEGRPFVRAWILLPGDAGGDVWLLIDTGSDTTTIMPRDAARLGVSAQTMEHGAEGFAVTAGGLSSDVQVPAHLAFGGDTGVRAWYLNVGVSIAMDPSLIGLPSLLGADVLRFMELRYAPFLSTLELHALAADRVTGR
jgi:hypothetical protein